MLMNYSEHKEGAQESYEELYQELGTLLRMTGYLTEKEYADYEGYDFLDKCCIFIGLAKIAMDDNVDISEIQGELKEIFESNRVIDQTFKDSLVNLALLPTKDNIAKKSKRLNEITDNWLKNQITMYTGIDEIDFQKYSDVTLLPTLREQRKKLFLDAFCANRASTLKN